MLTAYIITRFRSPTINIQLVIMIIIAIYKFPTEFLRVHFEFFIAEYTQPKGIILYYCGLRTVNLALIIMS